MFCRNCGTALAENAKFCTNCGTGTGESSVPAAVTVPLSPPPSPAVSAPAPTPAPTAAPQPTQYPPYPSQKKSNTGLVVALAGALILLVLLGGYIALSRGGEEVNATMANAAAAQNGAMSSSEGTPSGSSATPDDQPYNGPTEGPAVGPEVTKYVSSDANIRNIATAQGKGSKVTGTLKRGAQVKGVMHQGLAGSTTHWLKLSDGRGYVSAINLGDGPPAAVATTDGAKVRKPLANANYCSVATSSGNLRIRATPNGKIIGGMPPGARFQTHDGDYDEEGTYWVQVQPVEQRYPVGWVSADHVAC